MSPGDQTQKSEAWQQALLLTGLVRVSVAVIKIPSAKQFERKKITSLYSATSQCITEGSWPRTQGWTEVEAVKECCSLACSSLLALPAFLYYPGPPTQGWVSWAHPHQSLIKKMHLRLVSWRRFLNRGSLFTDDPSLNQVDNFARLERLFFPTECDLTAWN